MTPRIVRGLVGMDTHLVHSRSSDYITLMNVHALQGYVLTSTTSLLCCEKGIT